MLVQSCISTCVVGGEELEEEDKEELYSVRSKASRCRASDLPVLLQV